MKKVFYVVALSFLSLNMVGAQDLVAANDPMLTRVSFADNLNKAVFDYSGVEEIRAHIINDKDLSHFMDLYGPVPEMKLAVRLNAKGYITEVTVVEGGYGEHAYHLKKSIQKLQKVTPIKIEGINVNQKVLIPISFK